MTRATVILADVNVLVYAFDESSTNHEKYRSWLSESLRAGDGFALVDTVLSGFLRIVTHPKIFAKPAPVAEALQFVEVLIDSPSGTWVQSNRATWKAFSSLSQEDSAIRGNLVPDAYLASLALANSARVATADRGFARYPGLRWFDPAREFHV